jgi:uridine kinase
MRGDSIIVEEHHLRAARKIVEIVLPHITESDGKYSINVAGESGSGKSEVATAIANELDKVGIRSVLLQQDDYFIYPPKTNDRTRRKDINWVGPQEVHLDVMDKDIREILDGAEVVEKPLVIYEEDRIKRETISAGDAKVIIADGTYTTLLKNLTIRTFIDRTFTDTKKHRERRMRDASELDEFIDKVLEIEHRIISSHKPMADLIISKDYEVSRNTK